MRALAHSLGVVFLAVIGVVALGLATTMTTVAQLLATTALIMGGTGLPVPDPPYISGMTDNYVTPLFGAPDDSEGVNTPEEFFPVYGFMTFDQSVAEGVEDLEDSIAAHPGESLIVVGYSQSARIATIEKRRLIDAGGDDPDAYDSVSFSLAANVNRGNGGILERFSGFGSVPLLGIAFDGATPTDSPQNPDDSYALPTKDVIIIHDGWSDFPVYLNLLATVNALAGIVYLHPTYPSLSDPDLVYQGSLGDTDYYAVGTDIVPILMPLQQIGIPRPILLAMDEPLRVLIEMLGYRRDINPGTPTPVGLFPQVNLLTLAANLFSSIQVGIDDALADLGLGRPLGTAPSGLYGVGGPELPPEQSPALSVATPGTPAPAAESLTAEVNKTIPAVEPGAAAVEFGSIVAQHEPVVSEPEREPVVGEPELDVATPRSLMDESEPAVADSESEPEPSAGDAKGVSGLERDSVIDELETASSQDKSDEKSAREESGTQNKPAKPTAITSLPSRNIVRGPIRSDRPKPSAVRPSGYALSTVNGPPKKVPNALMGGKPRQVVDTGRAGGSRQGGESQTGSESQTAGKDAA